MGAHASLLEGLVPLVGSTVSCDRQETVAWLRRCEAEAAQVRAWRRDQGLAAPPVAFLSLTSPSAFARCNCATSLHGWSIDVPRPLAERILTEVERSGVFICAITGRGRWIGEDLLEVLRRHDRQVFLLCVHPDDFTRNVAEQIAGLPHVLPLIETCHPDPGCGGGASVVATREALQALRAFRIPFGFAVTAGEGNLDHLMGIEFYDACLQEHASFGLVVDCLQIPSCDELCRPVRPSERAALGRHIGGLGSRLGGLFAYLPWDLAEGGWCLAAPHQADSGAFGSPGFTLLHVASSRPVEDGRVPRDARPFESLRISPLGERRDVARRETFVTRRQVGPAVG
ncbi:MAG: hypothetical protein AAB434_00935 [Planctomycetota bacterium]